MLPLRGPWTGFMWREEHFMSGKVAVLEGEFVEEKEADLVLVRPDMCVSECSDVLKLFGSTTGKL